MVYAEFFLVSQGTKQIDKHRPSGWIVVCSESGLDWPCGLYKTSQVWDYEYELKYNLLYCLFFLKKWNMQQYLKQYCHSTQPHYAAC